jgi:hypothetical protein
VKVAVSFPDPAKTVADYLKLEMATPVRANLVGEAPPFMLLVRPDGPAQPRYPVSSDAGIRVIAWAPDEFQARKLASEALTVLAQFPGNAEARGIGAFSGPDVATDPVTGRDLAYFIATVRQRPVAI